MDWVEDFCKTLNANPLIAISARKDSKFSCKFLTQIDPQFLKQFQKIEANIDFICGFTKPKDLELGKWNYKESVKSADMFQRNIISFDIDESFKPIGNLSPLPWLVVNSGNGYHLHYKLKEPLGLANDKDRAQYALLYEHLAYKLSSQLGHELDMGAAKPARFMRLPGSLNCKALDIHPIQTFVIEWNETSILDLSPILKNLVINPLTSPELKGFSDDGFRNEVLRATNWERVFSALGLNYNAKTSGSSVMVLSPFRPEKTASLSLSPGGLWIDFGDTTLKGDLPQFLIKLGKSHDYNHALNEMAKILGVPIPSSRLKPKQKTLQVVKPSQVANEAMQTVTQPQDSPLALDEVTEKRIEKSQEKEEKKKPTATYEQYEAAFDNYFIETKLCMFTGELMYRHSPSEDWKEALTNQHISHLTNLSRFSKGFFSPSIFSDALTGTYSLMHHNVLRKPEFLIEIPEWDGVDYISLIVSHIKGTVLPIEYVIEIFKMWGSNMIRRIDEADDVRNPVLILKGGQKIGKDTLVKLMFGGLKDYLVPFIHQSQERDFMDLLRSGLILHIEEFDRITNKQEVSALKAAITRTSTRYRSAYERTNTKKLVRASWIATCNEDNIFKDSSGSSRFWMIELARIDFDYPKDKSLQVLAQCKALAKDKYSASPEALAAIEGYADALTPESFESQVVGAYQELMRELMINSTTVDKHQEYFKLSDIKNTIEELQNSFGIKRGYVERILHKNKLWKKDRLGNRIYRNPAYENESKNEPNSDPEINF